MRNMGSCIDTCMDTTHTSSMTTTSTAAANVTIARTAKATAVAAFEAATTPRASKAAGRVLDTAEMNLNFAIRDYEMAVRAENPTATEREIQTMARVA